MYSKTTLIKNRTGLHARPASDFIDTANVFVSDIWIQKPDKKKFNAKSIVMLLAGSFSQGDTVIISAEGSDEKEAVDKLTELIDSGFEASEGKTA